MSERQFGPLLTGQPAYLPPGYSPLAYPSYPKQATHTISSQRFEQTSNMRVSAGLHDQFARVNTSRVSFKDLDKKGNLVDYLSHGTEVIVFNEACGYNGQWAEVIVVGNWYHQDGVQELTKLFVRREYLEPISTTKESHPIVDDELVRSPALNFPLTGWRTRTPEFPYYDNNMAAYCVVMEYNEPSFGGSVNRVLEKALLNGTKLILDYYSKDYDWSLEDLNPDGLKRDLKNNKYFSFSRAEDYYINPRPRVSGGNQLRILVRIPQIYFDTYDVKEASRTFGEALQNVENATNRFLDQNNGTINTNMLRGLTEIGIRNLTDDGELPDWMTNDVRSVEIFGEEIVWLEEDAVGRTLLSPEEIAAATQERIDTLNDVIGDLPETLYNRFVPGEFRDAVEGALEDIRDAYAAAEAVSEDITNGLQSSIDTINIITSTLNSAPDPDSVDDALAAALTDPNVDMNNISQSVMGETAENEALRRAAEEKDIEDVVEKLEGTLVHEQWEDLADGLLNDRIPIEDYNELVTEMKRIDFYARHDNNWNKEIEYLQKKLENFDEKVSDYQGDVEGWIPSTDVERLSRVTPKLKEYIKERSTSIHGDDNEAGLFGNKSPFNNQARLEFGFTANFQLVYVGYKDYYGDNTEILRRTDAYGEPLKAFVRGNPPFDSETIMAYLWKLKDIFKDNLTSDEVMIPWANKYVYPNPRFIYKPRQETDITAEREANNEEILKLKQVKKDRGSRVEGQQRIRQAIEAVNFVEANVDTGVNFGNDAIQSINSVDDVFNNYFDGLAADNNPIVAALIKCAVPTLDFDLLPEIPDFDLSLLRNPLVKFLELWELITPPDSNFSIKKAIQKALEQAANLLYVTAVKLALESLAAACLQLQAASLAGLLEAVDELIDPDPDSDNIDGITISSGINTSSSALKDAAVLKAFKDVGIIDADIDNNEAILKTISLFEDVSVLLTPVELCQLSTGNPANHVVDMVINLIQVKHSHFSDSLSSKSKVIDLFAAIGKYVDLNVCDDILVQHETASFGSSFGGLACDISEELSKIRRSILACDPSLTAEMIEDIIARENEQNLENLKSVLKTLGGDRSVAPIEVNTAATDKAKKMAFESLFSTAETALNRELKEYHEYMTRVAELSLGNAPTPEEREERGLPEDYKYATVLEVLEGTRTASALPRPYQIAKFFRNQIKNIETNSVFVLEEQDDGFVVKLRSPQTLGINSAYNVASEYFDVDDERTFDLSYKLRNKQTTEYSALNSLVAQATSAQTNLVSADSVLNVPSSNKKDRFSLSVANPNSGEEMFYFSSKIEVSELIKNYIDDRFQDVNFDNEPASPQQVYFEKFINRSESGNEDLSLFFKYGVFSQITRDIIAFLGREIADSKYFKFYEVPVAGERISNIQLLELENQSMFDMDTLTTEAVEYYKDNKSNDRPPPQDALQQRRSYNSFEVAGLQQSIKSIIKLYVIEYFIKGLFVTSTFDSIEEAEDIAVDYILEKVKREIPEQFSNIFNYKFFYLARGIHQDSLETGLSGDDYNIDYVIKKHIREQYLLVSQKWKKLFEEERVIAQSAASQDLVTAPAMMANTLSLDKSINQATRRYLDSLPVKEFKPEGYESPENFYDDQDDLLRNGNFYFEKYVHVEYVDGRSEIVSPAGLRDILEEMFYLDSDNIYIEGDASEDNLLATANNMKSLVQDQIADGKTGVYMNIGQLELFISRLTDYGATFNETKEVIEAAKDISNNWRNNEITYDEWAGILDALISKLREQFTEDSPFDDIKTISHGARLLYLMPYGDVTRKDVTLTSPEISVDKDKKYSFNFYDIKDIDNLSHIDVRNKGTYEVSISINNPLNPISGDVSGSIDVPLTLAHKRYFYAVPVAFNEQKYTDSYSNLIDEPMPDNIFQQAKNSLYLNADLKFLFEYVFPIEKYKSLMSIYTVESMGDIPGLEKMFLETKAELRSVFNKMDSRGRFGYMDKSREKTLEEIRKAKEGVLNSTYVIEEETTQATLPTRDIPDDLENEPEQLANSDYERL